MDMYKMAEYKTSLVPGKLYLVQLKKSYEGQLDFYVVCYQEGIDYIRPNGEKRHEDAFFEEAGGEQYCRFFLNEVIAFCPLDELAEQVKYYGEC